MMTLEKQINKLRKNKMIGDIIELKEESSGNR
jgi:hypothetical protein